MKRTITGIAAVAMVLGTIAPAAFAATTSSTVGGRKAISVNGTVVSNPYTRVAKDGGVNTSFIGVWYLGQAVKAAGGDYTWDPATKIFNITAPGVDASKISIPGGVGSGNTTIQVNGTTVKMVNSYAWQDPAGSKSDVTTFMPIFYLGEIFSNLGGSSWDGSAFGFKSLGTLAITGTPSGDVGIGTKEALGATVNGTAVTGATWSVDNSGAVIDQTGNFVASAPGTYTVTAKYNGLTATAAVVVYGQAAAYKVTSNASNLLADGTSYNTITVTAVDSNGNAVLDYSGVAAVTDSATPSLIGAATTAGDQPTDFNSATNQIMFTNGVATFAVGPTSAVGVSDTITAADTNTSAPLTSTTYTFTSAASTLSQLAVAVTSGSPAAISANGQYSTNLTLSAENAAGNTMSGQPGTYVVLTLTGPGSFVSGTTAVTTETVYVGTNGTAPVTVYSMPGMAGSINISATATGLTGANLTVPSYINTAPGSLSVTSTAGTDVNGNAYTLYTVQLLDTNGHPITTTAANDAFTVTDNSASVSGVLQYGTYNSTINAFTPVTLSPATYSGTLTNGIATFAVETNTVGTSPTATLTVTDTPNSFTTTSSYSYAAGAAYQMAVTPSVQYTVTPGQMVTFSAQLQDANGNPVAKAGEPITFGFQTGNNTLGLQFPTGQITYVVDTNANGVASVSFTVPSGSAAGSLGVTVTDTNFTAAKQTANSSVVSILGAIDTSNYATQIALKDASSNTVSTYSTTANASLTGVIINAIAENAIGTAIALPDEFEITSSNTNVVSVNTADVAASATGLYNIANDLTVGQAGSAAITVKDLSNQSAPTASFTVVVNPGTSAGAVVEYNGAAFGSSNTLALTSGQAVQLQVVNADAAGDPLPITGSTAVTVNLGTNGVTGDFRLSPTGAPVTSVTLQPGQSSVPVYFVSSTAETLNTGSQLMAVEQSGVSANGSVTTNGVAAVAAVVGAGNLVVSGADTTAGTYTVSVNGSDTTSITTPGADTAAQVATLIATAFASDATYTVTVDGTNTSQVDFVQKTATNGAVTPSMAAGTGVGLSGAGTSTTTGVTATPGTAEVYTLSVNSGATVAATLSVGFSDESINQTVSVGVTAGETAASVASAIASALNGNTTIHGPYTAAASGSTVTVTANAAATNKTIVTPING